MIKSIQHFQTEGVKKLEDIFVSYSSNLSKIAEMVEGVTKSVVELGCSMIAEEWEFYDKLGTIAEDGTMVRRIATRIISYKETSLVSHGADPFAQLIKDNKINNENSLVILKLMLVLFIIHFRKLP